MIVRAWFIALIERLRPSPPDLGEHWRVVAELERTPPVIRTIGVRRRGPLDGVMFPDKERRR